MGRKKYSTGQSCSLTVMKIQKKLNTGTGYEQTKATLETKEEIFLKIAAPRP
jgi:hypothetical protein